MGLLKRLVLRRRPGLFRGEEPGGLRVLSDTGVLLDGGGRLRRRLAADPATGLPDAVPCSDAEWR